MIEMALKLEIVSWLNAVAPFIGNVQLSNIMLRNQHFALLSSDKSYFRFCSQLGYL